MDTRRVQLSRHLLLQLLVRLEASVQQAIFEYRRRRTVVCPARPSCPVPELSPFDDDGTQKKRERFEVSAEGRSLPGVFTILRPFDLVLYDLRVRSVTR